MDAVKSLSELHLPPMPYDKYLRRQWQSLELAQRQLEIDPDLAAEIASDLYSAESSDRKFVALSYVIAAEANTIFSLHSAAAKYFQLAVDTINSQTSDDLDESLEPESLDKDMEAWFEYAKDRLEYGQSHRGTFPSFASSLLVLTRAM